MILRKILVFLAIASIPCSLFSKIEFYKSGTYLVNIFGGYASSSSFYDMDGENISSFIDDTVTTEDSVYTWEAQKYTIGIRGQYAITDNFSVSATIPLDINTYKELFSTNDEGIHRERARFSLVQPEYYGIGVDYLTYNDGFYNSVGLYAKIPPGFHNGITSDSTYEYLSDRAFELLASIKLGYIFEKSWLELAIAYNYRDEEMVDQAVFHLEGGLSSIPETKLYGIAEYCLSTESFDNAIPYYQRNTSLQANIFRVGFSFQMFFSKNFYAEVGYIVSLLGKNGPSVGEVKLNTGFLIR